MDALVRGTAHQRPAEPRRRSWPWWIVAVGALLAGVLPSIIVGLVE